MGELQGERLSEGEDNHDIDAAIACWTRSSPLLFVSDMLRGGFVSSASS